MARTPEWPAPLREAAQHSGARSGFRLYMAEFGHLDEPTGEIHRPSGPEVGDTLLTIEMLYDAKDRVTPAGRIITEADVKAELPDPVLFMAWTWLTHAQQHLGAQLNTYLRGGTQENVDPVRAALVTVQAIARGLETAAEYLDEAAIRLKSRSDAHGASVTHEHAREIWASHMAIVSEPDPDPDPDQDLDGDPSG